MWATFKILTVQQIKWLQFATVKQIAKMNLLTTRKDKSAASNATNFKVCPFKCENNTTDLIKFT